MKEIITEQQAAAKQDSTVEHPKTGDCRQNTSASHSHWFRLVASFGDKSTEIEPVQFLFTCHMTCRQLRWLVVRSCDLLPKQALEVLVKFTYGFRITPNPDCKPYSSMQKIKLA